MSLEENKYYLIYKKNEKFIHFLEGIVIILLLIIVWISFIQSRGLQEEISENCGWGEKDYECFCKKGEVIAMKNKLRGEKININITNVDS